MSMYDMLFGDVGEADQVGLLCLRALAMARGQVIDDDHWLFDYYLEEFYCPEFETENLPWLMEVTGNNDEEVFKHADGLLREHGFIKTDESYQAKGHQYYVYYQDTTKNKDPDDMEVHVVIYKGQAYFSVCFGSLYCVDGFTGGLPRNFEPANADLYFCDVLNADMYLSDFEDFGETPEEGKRMSEIRLKDEQYLLAKRKKQLESAETEEMRKKIRKDICELERSVEEMMLKVQLKSAGTEEEKEKIRRDIYRLECEVEEQRALERQLQRMNAL